MNKELRQLLSELEAKENEAHELLNKKDVTADEIKAKTEEIKAIKAKIEAHKIIDEGKELDDNGIELTGKVIAERGKEMDEFKDQYKKAFLNAFRGKAASEDYKILNAMSENTSADGGLLVPQDIQTKINQYKRALPQLETLINVIPVNTLSGSRVFEKIATMTPFANITDDTADIEDMGNPQFENVAYQIKKYAGWMPVPNDLLNDSDQNIIEYLSQWIARKSVVTRNSLIIGLLNTLTKVTFTDWKAIKKAINITLDPVIAAGATIVTNQDGFQYLDTLTDAQNRPLLVPDVTNPSIYKIFGKPIFVVPNTVLATTGTTTKLAPVVIGNFVEAITMFERQGYQIASTNIGGTAFRKDRTEIRVIEREDVKLIDSAAAVYGQVDVTAVA